MQSRRFLINFLFYGLLLSVFGACKTYSDDEKAAYDKQIVNYIAKKKWDMARSDSGLYVRQLAADSTESEVIQYNSQVTLNYKGRLLNGDIFDQTPPGVPFRSSLKGLIMGFQEALLGQKKGAKLLLVIPPYLGYGEEELEKIPANSILIFEVEVLEVQ